MLLVETVAFTRIAHSWDESWKPIKNLKVEQLFHRYWANGPSTSRLDAYVIVWARQLSDPLHKDLLILQSEWTELFLCFFIIVIISQCGLFFGMASCCSVLFYKPCNSVFTEPIGSWCMFVKLLWLYVQMGHMIGYYRAILIKYLIDSYYISCNFGISWKIRTTSRSRNWFQFGNKNMLMVCYLLMLICSFRSWI